MNITRKKIYYKPLYSSKTKRNRQLKELKMKLRNVSNNDVVSIDETSIDTHIGSNYGWSKKGVTLVKHLKHIKTRYSVVCAVSNRKIIHYTVVKGSINGEIFLNFIKTLETKLGNTKKYLLMDNARIHHYSKLKEYIITKPLLESVYNVPYSPEYNPIEMVFNECKSKLRKYNITNKNIIKKISQTFKLKTRNLKAYFKKSLNLLR
jgi:putative transposase